MTTLAGNGNALVIKYPASKLTGVMTHSAVLGSGDVIYRLTNGCRAIVAGCAITGDIHVIEDRWSKCRGSVTKMAILLSGYMVSR